MAKILKYSSRVGSPTNFLMKPNDIFKLKNVLEYVSLIISLYIIYYSIHAGQRSVWGPNTPELGPRIGAFGPVFGSTDRQTFLKYI